MSQQAGRKRAQDGASLDLRLRPQDRTGGPPPAARGEGGRRVVMSGRRGPRANAVVAAAARGARGSAG